MIQGFTIVVEDMCETRTNTKNIIPIHIAAIGLYIPVKITNPSNIKLPKMLLNKLTNKLGTAYITSHIRAKNATIPITTLAFFSENNSLIVFDIYNLYYNNTKN